MMRPVNFRAGRGAGLMLVVSVAAALALASCEREADPDAASNRTTAMPHVGTAAALAALPAVDLSEMEPQVVRLLQDSRAAVESDPASGDAWWRLAAVHDAHNLDEPAVAAYRQALAIDTRSFSATYNLAIILDTQQPDSEESLELLRRAGSLQPDYAPAALRLGEALAARGRADEASEQFQHALEIDPDLLRARRSLGQQLLSRGDDAAAMEQLVRVSAVRPDDGPTHAALAQVYGRLGRADDAASAAARARDGKDELLYADPERRAVLSLGISSLICRRRARQHFDAGEFAKAVPDLQVVVSIEPDDVDAQYRLGYAAARAGRPDLAQAHLEQVLRLDAANAPAMVELGGLALQERKFEEAAACFRRAMELRPDAAGIRWFLAGALAQSGQSNEALTEFERAEFESPGDSRGQLNWGMTLMHKGDAESAAAHFSEAVRIQPEYVLARCNLGAALERMGRLEEAIEHYAAAVRIDPTCMAAQRLRALGVALDPTGAVP